MLPEADWSIETLLKAARSARRSSRDDDEPCRLASHLDKLESGISNLRELLASAD